MSRKDCVSNRNTKIILTYLRNIIGDLGNLLDGIDYPVDRHPDAESYYLNEDEWDSLENYGTIYHRAKELVGDPNFFFNCGASSARYQSWGSFKYFKRIMAGPKTLYERVPTFNKNFNDTKEFDIIVKPHEENARIMSGKLLITDPQSRESKIIGREVFLVPETRPNKYADPSEEVFLGKYSETGDGPKTVMLTENVVLGGEEVAKKGTLFKAPYFIINV